jgi:hypothetical protein
MCVIRIIQTTVDGVQTDCWAALCRLLILQPWGISQIRQKNLRQKMIGGHSQSTDDFLP